MNGSRRIRIALVRSNSDNAASVGGLRRLTLLSQYVHGQEFYCLIKGDKGVSRTSNIAAVGVSGLVLLLTFGLIAFQRSPIGPSPHVAVGRPLAEHESATRKADAKKIEIMPMPQQRLTAEEKRAAEVAASYLDRINGTDMEFYVRVTAEPNHYFVLAQYYWIDDDGERCYPSGYHTGISVSRDFKVIGMAPGM
jgi:hypothetical protein